MKSTNDDGLRSIADFMCYLHVRYADARVYRTLADYEAAIKERLPRGATGVELTFDPFEVRFRLAGQVMTISTTADGAQYSVPLLRRKRVLGVVHPLH